MNVMLRFGRRLPDVERDLASFGYEIIVPRALARLGRNDQFQITLASSGTFSQERDAAYSALSRLTGVLSGCRGADSSALAQLDFGIDADDLTHFYADHTIPLELMRLLLSLRIELNITIYAPTVTAGE